MLRLAKWLVVPVVLGLLLGMAAPALAVVPSSGGPPYSFSSIQETSCEPYGTILVGGTISITNGERIIHRRQITNLRTGESLFVDFNWTYNYDLYGDATFGLLELVPEGTQPGDMLVAEISGTYDGKPFSTNIAFDCSTGLAWTPYVGLVSDEEAAPFLDVAAPNGQYACGVFNVMGHGPKTLLLSEFPACTGPASNYTIYCFTGSGIWSNQYVSDVGVDDNGNLTFTSGQHGHCGIFPIP